MKVAKRSKTSVPENWRIILDSLKAMEMRTAEYFPLRKKVKSNLKHHKKDYTVKPFRGKSPYLDLWHNTITNNGIAKLLSNLNPHKAYGPDSIPARLLKEITNQLAAVFTILLRTSIDQGNLPHDWKHAFVTILFKKGERSKASNYQQIFLTSIVCKCLKHIRNLDSNIISHLESLGILHDAQPTPFMVRYKSR